MGIKMTKYHITPDTGKPNICNPKKTGICKYAIDGVNPPHYESKHYAQKAYEKENKDQILTILSKDKRSNINPETGFLTEEAKAKIVIHDIQCNHCSINFTDPDELSDLISNKSVKCSNCKNHTDITSVRVELTPSNPSYKFLDVEEVRKATWYHATVNSEWLEDLDEDFEVHLGTENAAFDRAITNYAPHNDYKESFFLYEVRIKPDSLISEEIKKDENEESISDDKENIIRYINRWEDAASISLAAPSNQIEIIGKKLVKPSEAHERITVYNIPQR